MTAASEICHLKDELYTYADVVYRGHKVNIQSLLLYRIIEWWLFVVMKG